MYYAIAHVLIFFIVFLLSIFGGKIPDGIASSFGADAMIMCFGIIGVCTRLDKIIKKLSKDEKV